MAFLELNAVSIGSGVGPLVLNQIDLKVERGEFVAIVGYSGAGKTTLISLIAGLIRPDSGTIMLNDHDLIAAGPARGVAFQNPSFEPWLSIYENIFLAVDQVSPNWTQIKKKQHTERYIGLVNLTAVRDQRPREVSSGIRQRVSVARALAMDSQILLLDDPLHALDAATRAALQDEINRLWKQDKKTILLVTNDVDEGILMADRIIPLSTGPGATLGPSIDVAIPRPRHRKNLNHDPNFKVIRRTVIDYLLSSGACQRIAVPQNLSLPPIDQEDLSELYRPVLATEPTTPSE